MNSNFSVANTVVDGINKKPNQTTKGDGAASGGEVQITITFTPPIVLPAPTSPLNHYFFRPEVQVTGAIPVPVGAEVAWDAVCGRPAGLDSQLGLGTGLAANWH